MSVIVYKGRNLHSKSYAAELLSAKKFKELDEHIEQVEKAHRKLQGDPTEAIAKMRSLLAARGFTVPQ